MPEVEVRRIIWRTADVAQILTLTLLFLFLWRFFWMVHSAIFLAVIALLLAIILNAPATYLSRWIPFRLSFALVLILFGLATAGLMLAIIPQILDQATQLTRELPAALDDAANWFASRTGVSRDTEFMHKLDQHLADFVGRFVPFAFNLINTIIGFSIVVFLAIFLASQPLLYRNLLIRLVPPQSRATMERIYDEAGRSLRNWVLAKALTMVAVGIVVWIGLLLFGIPGALALAALAALLEFIPNLGPTLAATPAVIAAFLISPITALWVAIFFFVMQHIQSAITVPLVEKRAVNIPPAALLIWQLMLAVGFGILGLFVSTPLLAILVIAGKIVYLEPSEARFAHERREN